MDKKLKIRILSNSASSKRGPGVVHHNLIKGFDLPAFNNIAVYQNELTNDDEVYTACLSPTKQFENLGISSEDIDLVGPNNWEIPTIEVASKYQNFLVPSQWVKGLYESFDCMQGKNIHVWPVGIDTNEWTQLDVTQKPADCLIYHKNTDKGQLEQAIKLCEDNSLSFGVLSYGSYKEEDLASAVSQCKFCILVTKTESQGIAYMQILSSGLPCFVFEKDRWDDRSDGIACDASSVPYFDKRCGQKISQSAPYESKHAMFGAFLENIKNNEYNPREYIVENHALEISTRNFISILEGCR